MENQETNIRNIEKYAENLISASIADVCCNVCKQRKKENPSESDNTLPSQSKCESCETIKQWELTFINHISGFSCHKRKKTLCIKSNEGHGILDGKIYSEELNHLICRFNYPKFPTSQTTFIPEIEPSLEDEEVNKRKTDFRNI